ncbi:MAG: hypothetical protein LBQ68_00055 [Clostridiales bacterium]|nr:hypothetical protein [Clostridiales bacterium]
MVKAILKNFKSFIVVILSFIFVFTISIKTYAGGMVTHSLNFYYIVSSYDHFLSSQITDTAIYTFTIQMWETNSTYNVLHHNKIYENSYTLTGAQLKSDHLDPVFGNQLVGVDYGVTLPPTLPSESIKYYRIFSFVTIQNGTLPYDNQNDWVEDYYAMITLDENGSMNTATSAGSSFGIYPDYYLRMHNSPAANNPPITPLVTATNTPTPTQTPTSTPMPTSTQTPTLTPTSTPTSTPTPTSAIIPTDIPYTTPTFTPQPSPTQTPANNLTPTVTATNTMTPTMTPTPTNVLNANFQYPEDYDGQSADYENPDPLGENSAAAQLDTSQTIDDDDNSALAENQKKIIIVDGEEYYYDEYGNLIPLGSGNVDKKNPETRNNPMMLIIIIFLQLAAATALYITFKKRKRAERK